MLEPRSKDDFNRIKKRLRKKLAGSKWTIVLDCTQQESAESQVSLEFQQGGDPTTIRSGIGCMGAVCGHLAGSFLDNGEDSESASFALIGAQLLLMWDRLERDAAVGQN